MSELEKGSQCRATSVGLFVALAVCGGIAPDRAAGIVSGWMTDAPAIDGALGPQEWSEAVPVVVGTDVTARIGNDGRTLYLQMIDARPGEPAGDKMILFFDDEGGSPVLPFLDDGAWTNPDCQLDPALGEGEIWFHVEGAVDYYEWWSNGSTFDHCLGQSVADRLRFAVGLVLGVGVVYEVALPLDGPMPLRGVPGKRLGLQLRAVDGSGGGEVCYPVCATLPMVFGKVALATPRCNAGVEDFDVGPGGLPLDWTSTVTVGTGAGWVQSATFGNPDLCGANSTSGTGDAACVANGLANTSAATSTLRIPLDVAGQSQVFLYYLFAFTLGTPDDRVSIGYELADGSTSVSFTWDFAVPPPGTSAGTTVPLSSGNPPVAALFTHSTLTGGNIDTGFANLDNVRLVCNPLLFADDFDSGLTTHWSATVP